MTADYPTYLFIDAYVDAAIARIQAAEEDLVPPGMSLLIEEGDEEPNRIDKFPQVRVIPLIGEGDKITYPQGADHLCMVHNFSTTFIGFYQYRDIQAGLREVRKFGYNLLDLFVGENQYLQAILPSGTIFGVATLDNSGVKVGYRRSGDYIIHAFQVTLNQTGA